MLILFLIVVVDLIGFGIVIPLLPFYGEHYGASPEVVGLLMATYSFAQFIGAPIWGRLGDRMGRKPVLMISVAGAAVGYVWLGFAPALWSLFAARAFGGFMAGNIATAFAYVADVTEKKDRAKGMGMIGAAFSLGFIAGPAIGGVLSGHDPAHANYTTPMLVAAGLSTLAFVLASVFLKESLPPEKRATAIAKEEKRGRFQLIREMAGRPNIGMLLLLAFLSVFVFSGLEATFAMWSRRQYGWGPEQNGWLFAGIGFISAMIQGGMIGRLAKRFGEGRLVVQGAAALAIGLALIPFADKLWVLIVAMAFATYGFSVISPSLNSSISLNAADNEQGTLMGVNRSVTTLSRVLGPAFAGAIFGWIGKDWPYYTGAVLMVVVLLLALRSVRAMSTASAAEPATPSAERS